MTVRIGNLGATLFALWSRLFTLANVVLLFVLAAWLPERVSGWFFHLTTAEVVFEIAVHAVFMLVLAAALGTLLTLPILPFLLLRPLSRSRTVDAITRAAGGATVFACVAIALLTVMDSVVAAAHLKWFPKSIVFVAYCIAFAAALLIPKRRKQVVGSLDGLLSEKATRRTVLAAGLSSTALLAGEFVGARTVAASGLSRRASVPRRPNIVLITFDALSAEDMSLYGYSLRTTPRIDEFSRQCSVFNSFYSTSTFTTPGISSILTGAYPSEHHAYHLDGTLPRNYSARSLPHIMREAGYATAASVNNPAAYFLAEGLAAEFDLFPPMARRPERVIDPWHLIETVRPRPSFGSRFDEYSDMERNWVAVRAELKRFYPPFDNSRLYPFPPKLAFEEARDLLRKLPDGFFLWVHTLAPHNPYLPDEPYLGRFLQSGESFAGSWLRDQLSGGLDEIGRRRLRYDELLLEADAAFGSFLSELDGSGRSRDTAVVLTADHGECFVGGVFGHDSQFQSRPEIHIPLAIRTPGQKQGYRVPFTADQTSLLPTILEIAGLPKPDFVRPRSLVPWLQRDGQGAGEGLAFAQYLETDSVFGPLNSGTVGVIDGEYQYVLDLATGRARLRCVAEAHLRDLDRSAENPPLAQKLREVIHARFPDLPRLRA